MHMYLDFHAHFDVFDSESIRVFVENCEKNQTRTVISGGKIGDAQYASLEVIKKWCGEYREWLLPAAKIDLWDSAINPALLRQLKDEGFMAVKFIYPYYEYDHDLYMPVYEELERLRLPALFHTGDYRPETVDTVFRRPVIRNMHPLTLDRIARSFPRLQIVMAHLGTTYFRTEAAELLKTHPNIYADLGGCGNWLALSPEELGNLLGHRLYKRDASGEYFKKLVFGSDCYISIPEVQTKALHYYKYLLMMNDIPADIATAVMGENAAKWLNI